jgi:hypothetical protein
MHETSANRSLAVSMFRLMISNPTVAREPVDRWSALERERDEYRAALDGVRDFATSLPSCLARNHAF